MRNRNIGNEAVALAKKRVKKNRFKPWPQRKPARQFGGDNTSHTVVNANSGDHEVVILAGLTENAGDQLMVYRHTVVDRGHRREQLVYPVVYRSGLDKDSIEFDVTQTAVLFWHFLNLPFGKRLVNSISQHNLINADEFFAKVGKKK